MTKSISFIIITIMVMYSEVLLGKEADQELDQEFIDTIITTSSLTQAYVTKILTDPRRYITDRPLTLTCTEKVQAEGDEYKLTGKKSLQLGQEYYQKHKKVFDKTFERYPLVGSEYILAILRKETYFGDCTGTYNALAQLLDRYDTSGKKGVLQDITALLILAYDQKKDPYTIAGSSAGAIGLCQFLPRNVPLFGIDGNTDGMINLFDPEDAIPSIANFLMENHWQKSDLKITWAIWNYNHSWRYVWSVKKYARTIKPLLTKKPLSRATEVSFYTTLKKVSL